MNFFFKMLQNFEYSHRCFHRNCCLDSPKPFTIEGKKGANSRASHSQLTAPDFERDVQSIEKIVHRE
jgi:hypothetical protein